jgi:hypothetical protein
VDKFTGILLSLLFFFHFYQFSKNSRMKKLDDDGAGGTESIGEKHVALTTALP